MAKRILPPLTQEPVQHVDCTPDEDYPVRILEAHLQHASCNITTSGLDVVSQRVYDAMNEGNARRMALLEAAIRCLKKEMGAG